MEACLTRFAERRLQQLTRPGGVLADGVQILLRGLPGIDLQPPGHAVLSADWYWPTSGETDPTNHPVSDVTGRRQQLIDQREAAESACLAALAATPRRRRKFSRAARRQPPLRHHPRSPSP